MDIDFSKLPTDKYLGSGMSSTAYIVEIKKKKYVYKIGKIHSDQLHNGVLKYSDKSNYIYQELKFYKFIDTLPKNQSIFFMKLHHYKILPNCNHYQKSYKMLPEFKKSQYCIHQIIDFMGITLYEFLQNNEVSYNMLYGIMLQIYHIISILHKNKYLHADVYTNLGNITIKPSKLKTIIITINKKQYKIQTNGYIVSFIDYGNVETIKRENPHWPALNADFELVTFRFLVSIFHIVSLGKYKKNSGYSTTFLYIYKNHKEIWNNNKLKINQLYPGSLKWFNKYEQNPDIQAIFYSSVESESYAIIVNLMIIYFAILEPELFSKHKNYNGVIKYGIPLNVAKNLFKLKTMNDMAMYIYRLTQPKANSKKKPKANSKKKPKANSKKKPKANSKKKP
jgi:hypothetical protein